MGPTPPAKGTPCSSVFPAPAPASIPAPGPDLGPRVEQVNKVVGTETSSSASGGGGGISRSTSDSSTSSSSSSTKGKKIKRKSAASTATKRRRRVSDSGHCPPIPSPADCPWTSNKEQFEEARAKEARYSITNAPAATPEVASSWSGSVDTSTAIAVQTKSLRPWEWSTRDCAAVAEEAISSFSGFLCARPAGASVRVLPVSSLVGAGGRPIFSDGNGDDGDGGGDEDCDRGAGGGDGDGDGDDGALISDDDEDGPDEEREEPIANRQRDAAVSMKPRGEQDDRPKIVLSQNNYRRVAAGGRHQDQGREPGKRSMKSSKGVGGGIEDPVVEDSRKAKELSAALNRNPPRGVASQTVHQASIRPSAIDKFSGADKTSKKKRPRSTPHASQTPTISAAATKGRQVATKGSSSKDNYSNGGEGGNTSGSGGVGTQGHPWADSGLFFGKGTTAEVGEICVLGSLTESLYYRIKTRFFPSSLSHSSPPPKMRKNQRYAGPLPSPAPSVSYFPPGT